MTKPSGQERGSALLAAIIGADLQAVEAELERDPSLISYQVLRDTLIESIPHWLYAGDTLLHLAAASLQDDISETLIRRGAAVAAMNRRGASTLHYACDPRPRSGVWDPTKQCRVIRLLVDAGADVNLPDSGGVTPLHRAVRARGAEAVREILACGASVDARLKNGGSTPLHLAAGPSGASGTGGAVNEQLEIITALLDHGADTEALDAKGTTPRAAARNAQVRHALQHA